MSSHFYSTFANSSAAYLIFLTGNNVSNNLGGTYEILLCNSNYGFLICTLYKPGSHLKLKMAIKRQMGWHSRILAQAH